MTSIRDIVDAALAGDELALRICREAAVHLGRAVAGMMNLLNPKLVIVGGDMARLGDDLIDTMKKTVISRTLVSSVAAAEIRVSKLGPLSGAIGAATMVLKASLEDSRLFPPIQIPA